MKTLLAVAFFIPFSASAKLTCDNSCTFTLKKAQSDSAVTSNESRAHVRYSPFSTFKVPNSLIALELGIVTTPEQTLSFDRSRYPIEDWWRKSWYEAPLTLKQAFAVSAVPVYRQIAFDVGEKNMTNMVNAFDYGNKDITSGIDNFWLNGSISISAKEQIGFLQRLHEGKLPVSDKALAAFKDVMRVEETDDYTLYAKTGAGRISADKVLGWYIGIVENQQGVHYFAFNIETDDFATMGKKRIKMARQFLQQEGVM